MKKIFLSLLLFFTIFCQFFVNFANACAIPPDILNRFTVYEENNTLKVNYELFIWEDLKKPIEHNFYEKTGVELNKAHISTFIDKYIKDTTILIFNNTPLELTYENATFHQNFSDSEPFLEIQFSTQIHHFSDKNTIKLLYDKKMFADISNLVHAFIFSKIEDNLDLQGYKKEGEKRYDLYNFDGWQYGIFSKVKKEGNDEIQYKLEIQKIKPIQNSIINEQNNKKKIKDNPLLTVNQGNIVSFEGLRAGKYLETHFFGKDVSLIFKIIGILFAIIFGALHALLPGHAKSVVGAYIMSHNKTKSERNKEIFILVSSITLSHTFFIFVLAIIIYFFSSGLGSASSYVYLLSSIGYILFGIYFCYDSIKKFRQKKHLHSEKCNCGCRNTSLRKTLLAGILFGCNPCIDALAIFIVAFSAGNIGYATLVVLAFSLGLGLMLGILALLVGNGYQFLSNKKNKIFQKILNSIVFLIGIFIILFGVYGIFTNPIIS